MALVERIRNLFRRSQIDREIEAEFMSSKNIRQSFEPRRSPASPDLQKYSETNSDYSHIVAI